MEKIYTSYRGKGLKRRENREERGGERGKGREERVV